MQTVPFQHNDWNMLIKGVVSCACWDTLHKLVFQLIAFVCLMFKQFLNNSLIIRYN